jgi:hypothetical protein
MNRRKIFKTIFYFFLGVTELLHSNNISPLSPISTISLMNIVETNKQVLDFVSV